MFTQLTTELPKYMKQYYKERDKSTTWLEMSITPHSSRTSFFPPRYHRYQDTSHSCQKTSFNKVTRIQVIQHIFSENSGIHLEINNMEKAMAPHSSTLAWKIPWMEEPGRLQSVGSLRVRHKWATSLSLFTFTHWRRKWQPTPVFLPGESQGRGSLMGCHLWGRIVGHDWSDLAAAAAGRVKIVYISQ